jgi:transporter family protein
MLSWVYYVFFALAMWGLWGFLPKLTTSFIDPKSAMIYESIGFLAGAAVIFLLAKGRIDFHPRGFLFAFLTGIAGSLGALAFLHAMSRTKASIVVTTTSLYPLVSILLAFLILKERISLTQGLGMGFALVALILFSL